MVCVVLFHVGDALGDLLVYLSCLFQGGSAHILLRLTPVC